LNKYKSSILEIKSEIPRCKLGYSTPKDLEEIFQNLNVGKEYDPNFVDYIVTKILRDSESFEKMRTWTYIWEYFEKDFDQVKQKIIERKK
jgi:hypothetical protein